MIKFNIFPLIVTCLLLMLNFFGCTSAKTNSASPSLPGNTILTQDKIQADARQLVSIVESTQPAFSLKAVPDGYADAKKTFLAAASHEMSVDDFAWLARAYLVSLEDGHTSIFLNNSTQCLDVAWLANGSKLLLLDDAGKLTNRQVTAIGGVPVERIFQTVGKIFPAENDAGRDVNDTLMSVCEVVLNQAGVSCDTDQIALTVQDANQITEKQVSFITKNPQSVYYNSTIVSSRMIGDVFYIDLNNCKTGPELNSTVTQLKNAIAAGTNKVIIDVRDNPGGSSNACEALLAVMSMRIPQYGVYVRYSALAKAQRGFFTTFFATLFPTRPNPGTAKTNSRITLAVLTNENSFSSATMLGVWVQDGKLGKVIGQPSANSPNSYGDALDYQLNNSHIWGSVSFKRWMRPDAKADPKTLQPDVPVPAGGDVLQAALTYMDNE